MWQSISTFFQDFGWKIVPVLACIIIGYFIIKGLIRLLKFILYKTKMDNAVITFVCSVVKIVLWICIILIVASILQLSLSSLLVAFSSIALAVGLALKDSLANLANGILIIVNKPFRRGDHVLVGGVEGKIHNIKLLTTEIITLENEKVVVPNSTIITSPLTNFTGCPTRRISYKWGVAYGTDMNLVEKSVLDMVKADERVLNYPEPVIFMSAHGESGIEYTVRMQYSIIIDSAYSAYVQRGTVTVQEATGGATSEVGFVQNYGDFGIIGQFNLTFTARLQAA